MANFLKSLFVKGVEIDPAGAASDQVLKYNGTKFVPGTASTVGSIDDLSDVIVTTPSNGQALVYNGTDWVNGASGVAGSTYTATIGDGTNDVFVLSHGLNTRDVFVTIRNAASPYEVIDAYWAATTTGTVTIDFSVVPTTNSVRVAIYAAVTGNNTALALDTLTDVVISTPANGQFLEFDGTNWVNKVSPSNEPMGHENKADSVISFNEGTRTFSIAPASTSYTVWCAGKRFVKTTTSTVTIPDTSGLYYIYFDSSGVLSYRTSYFVWDTDAPTAYIYWNEVDNKAYFFADERHGITLDWATHEYLHRTRGAAIANGFGATNYILDGDGSLDSHAKLDIANGTFFDEDLQVDIVHSATPTPNTWQQVLQGNAKIPAFYRLNNHWVKDTATEFPLKQGTDRPRYNLNTAGTWSTPDVTNNHFGVSWIIATNNLNEPIIAIIGQDSYSANGAAQAEFYASLNLDGFPIVEFRPLYKIIYECKTSYTNTPSAIITDVLDLRSVISSDQGVGTTPVSDHGSMTGLADDDHTQYLTDTRHNALDHSTAMASVVIDDLSDVAITSPANGEILKYNSSTSLWTNASAGGVSTLNDLTDVSAASPITYQPLIWDGTNWQSGSFNQYLRLGEAGVNDWLDLNPQSLHLHPSAGLARFSYNEVVINDLVYQAELLPQELKWTDWSNGNQTKIQPIGATNGQVLAFNTGSSSYVPSNIPIDSLSDVVITSPTDGQVLKYNTATSLWTNASAGGGASITVSDTPPVSPTAGALWFESDSGLTFIYYDSQWIEIGAGASYDPITRIVQAKGDLILGTASQTVDRLTVGTNSQRLIANSSTTTGVSWASDSTNTVIDAKGDLLVGATADVVAKLPVGVDNQVLVADSTATNGLAWSTQANGSRNLIINGGMQVNQRATALTGTNTGYTVDRWRVGNYTGNLQVTTSQNSDVPSGQGFTHSLRMTVTTVGTVYAYDYIEINQAIEGLNSAQLAWGTAGAKTITVSFWVRSAVTGTYSIKLNNFGATRNYIASYTISAANTWEKKTITIAGETSGTWLTTNGSGVFLSFTPRVEASSTGAAGAWSSSSTPAGVTGHANAFATVGNIFAITGVQLEANTVATPFEHRPYGTELALCQRYYYRLGNTSVSAAYLSTQNFVSYTGTAIEGVIQHPVPMRTHAVTFGSSSVYAYNVLLGNYVGIPRAAVSAANSTTHAVMIVDRSGGTAWSTQLTFALIANTSAGYIEVSAEL